MEKFVIKRRKLENKITAETCTCDICYNDFAKDEIIPCFHHCTIKTCIQCILKQLQVTKTPPIRNIINRQSHKEQYSISYKCSMCQQQSHYNKLQENDTFRNWVQKTPVVLVFLLDKLINPIIEPAEPLNSDYSDDIFINTMLFVNETVLSPPLPFPYRLLTPPTISTQFTENNTGTFESLDSSITRLISAFDTSNENSEE